MAEENNEDMSVSEAGQKGGQRVRDLISEGKEKESGSESEDESET